MNKTKTVVIWVTDQIKFFIINRNLSHLNNKYVNSSNNSEAEETEINDIVYNEDGSEKVAMLEEFPIDDIQAGTKVIVMGFLP